MKKVTLIIITFFLFLLPTSAICEDWTGNLNFFLGTKTLEEDDWEPVEEQTEGGVLIDFKQKDWPVSIAIVILASSEEQTGLYYDPFVGYYYVTFEGETRELDFGIRKIWDRSPSLRPFIGLGITYVEAKARVNAFGISAFGEGDGTGFWIGGGVYWTIGKNFNLGLDVRLSQAEVTINNVEGEAGGTHAGLLIGYHW